MEYRLVNLEDYERGKHCVFIPWTKRGIKIFTVYPVNDWNGLDEFYWGDVKPAGELWNYCKLIDATIIQNYAALNDLAPRVYEIVKVQYGGRKYWGQIQDNLGRDFASSNEEALETYVKVKELGLVYGFENMRDDVSMKDVVAKKLVDWNTFHFTPDHLNKIKEMYKTLSKYGKVYYQQIPEWGILNSPRKNDIRIKNLGLENIDFKDKSVVDLGCAGGFFPRYAKSKGANKVLGIDFRDCLDSDSVLAAKIVSNELGFFDIDFEEHDLREYKPNKADIVFFTSMNFHIGIPKWLGEITNELCIFEDNSKNRDALETLKTMFREVKFIGKAEDQDNCGKLIYHCYK